MRRTVRLGARRPQRVRSQANPPFSFKKLDDLVEAFVFALQIGAQNKVGIIGRFEFDIDPDDIDIARAPCQHGFVNVLLLFSVALHTGLQRAVQMNFYQPGDFLAGELPALFKG